MIITIRKLLWQKIVAFHKFRYFLFNHFDKIRQIWSISTKFCSILIELSTKSEKSFWQEICFVFQFEKRPHQLKWLSKILLAKMRGRKSRIKRLISGKPDKIKMIRKASAFNYSPSDSRKSMVSRLWPIFGKAGTSHNKPPDAILMRMRKFCRFVPYPLSDVN